jgi:hypothetical protein
MQILQFDSKPAQTEENENERMSFSIRLHRDLKGRKSGQNIKDDNCDHNTFLLFLDKDNLNLLRGR